MDHYEKLRQLIDSHTAGARNQNISMKYLECCLIKILVSRYAVVQTLSIYVK